ASDARELERAANQAEREQRANNMQRDVDGMVSDHVEAAGRVIEREGQVDEWPAGYGRVALGKEHRAGTRQLVDLLVLNDRRVVVEDERTMQTVRVREDDGEDDDRRAPADAAGRGDHVAIRSFSHHSAVPSYSHIDILCGSRSHRRQNSCISARVPRDTRMCLSKPGTGPETRTLFFLKCSTTSTAGRSVSNMTKFVRESNARSIRALS